jgi:hypothetical protein
MAENWLRGLDLNQRPSGYEPERFHIIHHIYLILTLFMVSVFVVVFVFGKPDVRDVSWCSG